MTRAILMCFHKYTNFGDQFYEPLLDFQLQTFRKYKDEYDKVYLLDSTWNIDLFNKEKIYNISKEDFNVEVIKVDPSLRYYDAYKEVLPQIKEDLVLFMDNDMVVYKPFVIDTTFRLLDPSDKHWNKDGIEQGAVDVVSIIDQIGTYKTDKLKNGNKFCPYWFATRKDLLMKYLNVEWGPNMPEHETLGKLTEKMLEDGARIFELAEDKSDILFDGTKNPEKGKNLGYYHIRAGSTPAVLLAWKNSSDHQVQYQDYIKNQPKSEILRAFAWYDFMVAKTDNYKIQIEINNLMSEDLKTDDNPNLSLSSWVRYLSNFKDYHGLR